MIRTDFVSDEEYHFYHWLKEAESFGMISDIRYQPESYCLCERVSVPVEKQLKTKTKIVDKFVFHPHSYTPDFSFLVVSDTLRQCFKSSDIVTYGDCFIIDVKGTFSKFNDDKQFSINQKWMWNKFGIYVEKIIPEKLFKKTWVPEVCRLSPKQKKPVKKYSKCKTIKEFA